MLLFLLSWPGRHFSPSRSGLSYGRGGPHRMTENIRDLRPAALESSSGNPEIRRVLCFPPLISGRNFTSELAPGDDSRSKVAMKSFYKRFPCE